jgi:7-carboxy-7-deazaguanine synthase
MTDHIRISEIFGPTIQGEGALIGQSTVFVRTGGCDYRCAWCDTLHAVDSQYRDEWTPMSPHIIFNKVRDLSGGIPLMVSLSGGNPAIQNLKPLIDLGKADGYRFALETQGSIAQEWFADLDVLTLSPKPPSSKMNTDFDKLTACINAAGHKAKVVLKFVVFDDADYNYARQTASLYPALPIFLQPGNAAPPPGAPDMNDLLNRGRWLAEKTLSDRWLGATVLPQLHVLWWGNQRGV